MNNLIQRLMAQANCEANEAPGRDGKWLLADVEEWESNAGNKRCEASD